MKIVILEHQGDSGSWEWYDIWRASNTTPRKAVAYYCSKIENEKQEIRKINYGDRMGEEWINENETARAYYYWI